MDKIYTEIYTEKDGMLESKEVKYAFNPTEEQKKALEGIDMRGSQKGEIVELPPIEADDLVELLADEMHRKWMAWAESLLDTESKLSEERVDRWHEYLVDYDDLDERAKEIDRDHARYLVVLILQKFPQLVNCFVKKSKEELDKASQEQKEEVKDERI